MDPLTLLLGLGLTLGGNVFEGFQKQWYTDELQKAELEAYLRSRAAREEGLGIQKGFQNQADAAYQQAAQAISPEQTEQNRQQAEQAFVDVWEQRGTTQPQGQYLSGQENTTSRVQTEIAKRAATAAQDARTRVQALAKVGSFDQAMQANGLALQEQSGQSQILKNMMAGQQAVTNQQASLPAYQVMPGTSLYADALKMGGQAMTGFAGTGGKFGGGNIDAMGGYTPPWLGTNWLARFTTPTINTATGGVPPTGLPLFGGGR